MHLLTKDGVQYDVQHPPSSTWKRLPRPCFTHI